MAYVPRSITSDFDVARNTRLPLLVVVCREDLLTERTEAMRVASSIKRGESFLFSHEIDQLPLQPLQQFVWAGSN